MVIETRDLSRLRLIPREWRPTCVQRERHQDVADSHWAIRPIGSTISPQHHHHIQKPILLLRQACPTTDLSHPEAISRSGTIPAPLSLPDRKQKTSVYQPSPARTPATPIAIHRYPTLPMHLASLGAKRMSDHGDWARQLARALQGG